MMILATILQWNTELPTSYLDTVHLNPNHPQCVLKYRGSRCDTSQMVTTSLDRFPLQIHLTRHAKTSHCRAHPVNQITCPTGERCPDQLTCNVKMNGSRNPTHWSWECTATDLKKTPVWGKLYFETCHGNKDMSCINIGSYHFRPVTSAPPVPINLPKPATEFKTRSNLTIWERVTGLVKHVCGIILIFSLSLVFCYCVSQICSPEFILGAVFGLLLSGGCDSDTGNASIFTVDHEADD